MLRHGLHDAIPGKGGEVKKPIQTSQAARPKQPYQPPILRVYGHVAEFTATTSNMGANSDSRGFFMDSRTH